MIHVRPLVPLLLPPSSPRMPSFGKCSRRAATIATSLSRSARETQSLRALMSASPLPRCSQCPSRMAAPRFAAAIEAAKRGAAILLGHWEHLGKGDADIKARNDWVSRADRESEVAIVAALLEHFPNDGILGEEGGRSKGTSGRTWIIDPLDGTSNYLQHFPIWSISIGLKSGDEMIAGVIYEPLRDLFFTGERGAA